MRARAMIARLDRLPKSRVWDRKTWDLSLLSPEKQDRVDELGKVIFAPDQIPSTDPHPDFEEFCQLVRDLPLIGPDDPQQGPLIRVPGELHRYWQWKQPASRWRSLNFHKLGKVQTLRFV